MVLVVQHNILLYASHCLKETLLLLLPPKELNFWFKGKATVYEWVIYSFDRNGRRYDRLIVLAKKPGRCYVTMCFVKITLDSVRVSKHSEYSAILLAPCIYFLIDYGKHITKWMMNSSSKVIAFRPKFVCCIMFFKLICLKVMISLSDPRNRLFFN